MSLPTPDHGARSHRRFSPSQSSRFLACPGSVRLCERVPPSPDTIHSRRGTAAHELLDYMFNAGVASAAIAYDALRAQHDGDDAKRVILDQEDLLAVSFAYDYVMALLAVDDAVWGTERVVTPITLSAPGEGAGMCDVYVYWPQTRTLHVIDYKHGVGVLVDATENTQAMQYALGLLDSELDPLGLPVARVSLTVLQPRTEDKVKTWQTDTDTVRAYRTTLDRAMQAALAPDAPLVPGKTQCRWCSAAPVCPALEQRAVQALAPAAAGFAELSRASLAPVETMDAARLAGIHSQAEMVRAYLSTVEEALEAKLRQGQTAPGFKLVRRRTNRELYYEPAVAAAKLAAYVGTSPSVFYGDQLLPLGKLQEVLTKLLTKKHNYDIVAASKDAEIALASVTHKPLKNKLALVPESDKRPAANVGGTFTYNLENFT